MNVITRPAGVCVAALTPLTATLAPDVPGCVAYLRALLACGATAINLLGSTGEAMSLSVDARLAIMAGVAGSGLPLHAIMVGTGAAALDDAVRLTRAAVDVGFAGALVVPPFYFTGITDDGLFGYIATLIERVDRAALRLYLYHYPQLSGVPFALPVVQRLVAAYPATIVGLKDSSGDLTYADAVVAACPGLDVFPSSEVVLSQARERGFAGCISATFNLNAPLAASVWHGTDAAAQAADQAALTAIRLTVARYPLVPAIHYIAARLHARPALERMLPPLWQLTSSAAAALDAELAAQPAFRALTETVCA